MKIVKTRQALRDARALLSGPVGFVPTMGALHAGHMALISAAQAASGSTIVSIFVNPTQFGNADDLENYPSTFEDDLAQLQAQGVDLIFAPPVAEMYPKGADTIIETPRLATMLMGELRPGHFRGVATIVTKLFNLVEPEAAWFGEKDYQQLLVIRQLVRDLEMRVTIHAQPTVRETDGLAMSSRNRRLTPQDRTAAIILHKTLKHAENLALTGASASHIRKEAQDMLRSEPRATLKSVDLRDAMTLEQISPGPLQAPAVLLLGVEFGGILLIDNAVLQSP